MNHRIPYSRSLQDRKRREISYARTDVSALAAPEAHLHILAPETPLQEQPMEAVVKALYGLSPLTFWMFASAERVEAGINCLAEDIPVLERAVRGVASHWDLQRCDDLVAAHESFRFEAALSAGTRPDWLPIRDLASYKEADPLAAILEAVQPLSDDEELYVLLRTRPANPARIQQALRDLTLPATPANASALIATLSGKGLRVPRFERSVQKPLEERLIEPGFEVVGTVTVVGSNRDRLTDRARSLGAAVYSALDAGYGGLLLDSWRWKAGPEDVPWDWSAAIPSLYLPASELAVLYHPPSTHVTVPGVRRLRWAENTLPPQLLRGEGLVLGKHRQRGDDLPVHLSRQDLDSGHLICVGRTGVGKSTFMHHLLAQLISESDQPGVWVIDPHGDLQRDLIQRSIPAQRIDDVVLLDLGDAEFPLGLPLFAVPPGVPIDTVIQTTFNLLRSIFRDHWSETRMADTIFGVTATLCQLNGASLLDVPRLFQEPAFRRRTLAQLLSPDPVALQFWADYEQLSPAAQRELYRPVLYRLRSFYRSSAVRNLVCRTDGINFADLMNKIVLVNLAGSSIQAEADLLGELVIARFHLAAVARLSRPTEQRHQVYLAVDESARFKGASLPVLWAEGRKTGVALLMATQFIAGWGEALADSVLGNAGCVVAFRCGPNDSRRLANTIRPFTSEQLEDLNRYEAIIKLQAGGITIPAFDVTTLPITNPTNGAVLERIQASSRARYGKSRKTVEDEMNARYFPESPNTDWNDLDDD